jgi:uncharacterized protein (TIGR02145 family)
MRLLTLLLLFPLFLFSQKPKKLNSKDLVKINVTGIPNQNQQTTIKIGSQIWMTSNLDVSHFRNGDSIKEAKTDKEWDECAKNQIPAWCYYHNKQDIGKKSGKLYNWYAVNDSRGLAPVGYKIPDEKDWSRLVNKLGGESIAAPKMRYGKIWGDSILVLSSKDNFGAINSGWRKRTDEKIEFLNNGAYWWSATAHSNKISWTRYLVLNSKEVKSYCYDKGSGLSVRCLKTNK